LSGYLYDGGRPCCDLDSPKSTRFSCGKQGSDDRRSQCGDSSTRKSICLAPRPKANLLQYHGEHNTSCHEDQDGRITCLRTSRDRCKQHHLSALCTQALKPLHVLEFESFFSFRLFPVRCHIVNDRPRLTDILHHSSHAYMVLITARVFAFLT